MSRSKGLNIHCLHASLASDDCDIIKNETMVHFAHFSSILYTISPAFSHRWLRVYPVLLGLNYVFKDGLKKNTSLVDVCYGVITRCPFQKVAQVVPLLRNCWLVEL